MASDLDALQESIAAVLRDACDRRAVHDFFDGKTNLDTTLWTQAAELGWLACAAPEDDGGLGMGAAGLDLLHRELGRYLAPGPYLSTLSAAQWLAQAAPSSVKDKYLPAIMAGEMTVAVPALMGPAAPGALRVLGSDTATLAILPGADGAMRVVELGANEGRLTQVPTWDRTRQVCELNVEDLPEGAVVPGGDGLTLALALGVAADSLGAARSIGEQTIEYMKGREQFGRVIASFQALKHRVADIFVLLTTQDYLQTQAVQAQEQNSDALLWTLLSKVEATRAAAFVAADCVQLHGGVGHTWEYDPHIFLKRTRLNEALVAPNAAILDQTAELLAAASREGRTTAELPL